MKHKLSLRLALTYGIIFILAIAAIDTAVIIIYRDSQLKKNESYYYGIAGMLSSMVENNIRITDYIDSGGGQAGSGRVLLLNTAGRVLLDSGGELAGTSLTNPEFRKAVGSGRPAAGYYTYDGRGMAVFSCPVTISGSVGAAVVISVFIQDIYDDIRRFTIQIIAISILAAIIVTAVSILAGRRLSKPIARLTAAAEELYEGKSDATVDIERNDEIGILAATFNKMSTELRKVETGRRRFISDVSHELKTPLASIKALVESMITEDDCVDHSTRASPGECASEYSGQMTVACPGECCAYSTGERYSEEEKLRNEYLRDINHEIDRLTGLVRSLITSARLEEVELKREPLVLSEEADYAVRVLAPIAAQRHISLENICDPKISIHADRNMLREVFINLVDNAVKYGRENGYVRIGCTEGSFFVTDDGCGISKEELPNIFDSFYRVDRSRTGEGGSGIGLFIVKRVAGLHGFDVEVSSEPGKGSTFTIVFGARVNG